MIVEFPGLRERVRALRVKRGLLFHDALRWQIYLAPHGMPEEARAAWLREAGLDASAEIPEPWPRLRQIFRIDPADAPEGELHIPKDARFSCVACGNSCRTFKLGHLLPGDVDRLLALEWRGTGYDPATFFVDEQDQAVDPALGKHDLFLRRAASGCQFLRGDNLCDVQVRFGAAAKPFMCRLFPVLLRQSPTGPQVAVRLGECLSAPQAREGAPLEAQRPALLALLAEQDRFDLLPPQLWLDGATLVQWSDYEALEADLLALPGPGFAARALRLVEERTGAAPALPAHPFTYGNLRDLALPEEQVGLPIAAGALPLDEAGRVLEEQLCRQAISNKDLLQHRDVLTGAAQLAVRTAWCRHDARRRAARSGASKVSAEQVNRAWREFASTWAQELSSQLGELARSLAALALLELT